LELFIISFIGGFFGSVLMDVTESKMSNFGIRSGVNGAYVGRWVLGVTKGIFKYQDITKSEPIKYEKRTGQIFHFVIGGGVVALFYPIFLILIGQESTSNHIMFASVFGLLTSILPWFILMPSFGWGIFGTRALVGSKPIISPLISHLPYGFGIGLTIVVFYQLMA